MDRATQRNLVTKLPYSGVRARIASCDHRPDWRIQVSLDDEACPPRSSRRGWGSRRLLVTSAPSSFTDEALREPPALLVCELALRRTDPVSFARWIPGKQPRRLYPSLAASRGTVAGQETNAGSWKVLQKGV
jgi:hypothetical protein